MRAAEALAAHVRELKLEAQNAATNPRLVAALRGNADAATLQDLFRTEEWWEPYRSAVQGLRRRLRGRQAGRHRGDEDGGVRLRPARPRGARAQGGGGRDRDGQGLALRGGGRGASSCPGGRCRRCWCWPSRSTTRPSASWRRRRAAACCCPTAHEPYRSRRRARAGAAARRASAGETQAGPIYESNATAPGPPRSARWSRALALDVRERRRRRARGREHRPRATTAAIWSVAGLLALVGSSSGCGLRRQPPAPPRTAGERRPTAGVGGRAPPPAALPKPARACNRRRPGTGSQRAPGRRSATEAHGPHGRAAADGVKTISFGRYLLLDLLGEGGMAQVYTAVTFGAEGFRRTFVVKRLRAELAREPAVVAQFIDEANLASTLVHSNIIPVFDFGKVGDEYFLAQEYILGPRPGPHHRARSWSAAAARARSPPCSIRGRRDAAGAGVRAHQARRQRPAAGHRPPRRLAQQHPGVGARRGEAVRLRHRQGRGARDQDPARRGQGQRQLHVARAGARHRTSTGARDLFSLGLVIYYCLTGEVLYHGDDHLRAAGQGGDRPRPRGAGAHRRPPRPVRRASWPGRWRSIRRGATRPPPSSPPRWRRTSAAARPRRRAS